MSIIMLALVGGSSVCLGQTVTVATSGTPDFMSIQAAIDSFAVTDDPGIENVVEITDGGLYDEMITINVPLKLVGTGASRPVLAVQSNPAGYDQDGSAASTYWYGDAGLLIDLPPSLTTASLALHNLIIIPSRNSGTGTPPVAGIVNKANNFFLDMENVLVTSNDGSDQPVDTTGLVDASGLVHTSFLVSGGHLGSITNGRVEGDGVDVAMRDCIFTNIKGTLGDSWRTGFYMYRTYYVYTYPAGAGVPTLPEAFRRLTIDGKCIFSYNEGNGLRAASSLSINTPTDRCLFINNTFSGLWMDMRAGGDWDEDGTKDNENYVDGAIMANNGQMGINEGVNTDGPRMWLNNCIITGNGWYGTYHRLGSIGLQEPSRIENTTIVNNSKIHATTDQIQGSGSASTSIDLITTNTILGGDGNVGKLQNRIYWSVAGEINFVNTALITEGPFAFADPEILLHASATTTGTVVTNADPMFTNVSDVLDPDFLAVSNPVYSDLALDGGPLTGGGRWAGAAIRDWSVY